MIKAVIFDMDGVIVDSEPINYEVIRITFEKAGVEISKKEFIEEWVVKGTGSREAIKRHDIKMSLEDLQKIKKKIYLDVLKRKVKLKPDAKRTIINLHKKYKLALASQGHRYNVDIIVKKFKLSKFFQAIIGKQDVNKGKPNPEIFLKASKELKVKPEECLVIEDTEKGIIAAKRAGMICIAVPDSWTKRYNDFSKADLVVNLLGEINIDVIKNLSPNPKKRQRIRPFL
jgi:HAD superfamily hydrolase (TIGR01509 family)